VQQRFTAIYDKLCPSTAALKNIYGIAVVAWGEYSIWIYYDEDEANCSSGPPGGRVERLCVIPGHEIRFSLLVAACSKRK